MPVNGNITVKRSVLPDGVAGVDATVKKVVEMAQGVYGSKSAKIRAKAIDILRDAGIPDKDYYGEIVAIHNWVRDNIRYVHDPVGQETLSYPEETVFNSRAGDCDDMVITEIALLGAVGVEAYPVVVGMFPNHYSHIYLYAKVPTGTGRNAGKTIPLDPIMKNWPAGREAAKIKAKKTYPELANPLTMNGLSMEQDLGDLGSYAIAPSYLDTEHAHAEELLISDNASNVHRDKTVANGTQVSMPASGIDAMFCGGFGNDPQDAFSSTSAGDDGTIVQSGGQLVPKGFLREEPDLAETMAMTPASARRLGPLGPIYAYKASQNRDNLPGPKDPRVPTVARELRTMNGVGRYEAPEAIQKLRQMSGLSANPIRLQQKNPVVVLNSIPRDRLDAKPAPLKSLSGQLADAEEELAATLPAAHIALVKATKPQALHYAENWKKAGAALNRRAKELEQQILKLRQTLRDKGIPDPTASNNVRSQAVMTQAGLAGWHGPKNIQAPPPSQVPDLRRARIGAQPPPRIPDLSRSNIQALPPRPVIMDGLGRLTGGPRPMPVAGFLDTLKRPIVWGPALAFVGVLTLSLYLKKRRKAAAPA